MEWSKCGRSGARRNKQRGAMSVDVHDELARSTAESAARRSYGKLVAFLAARTRDVAAAEDALSEAFAAALTDWPNSGCPANPEGWLLTVARRKMIDALRGRKRQELAADQLQIMAEGMELTERNAQIPDQRLALMFACAHPAIDEAVRAPLILQVVLGLDAKAIASAFLSSPAAMGKRLVRAKEKIREAGIPFAIPERKELPARLDAVLDAIYAAFAEGWTDPAGTDVSRRNLTEETLFLARLVVDLLPTEAEALGVVDGRPRLHALQLWDSEMIREAEELLLRASKMGSMGRFQLEGALQSAHVYRCRTGEANWKEVVELYDALLEISGSPVVAINRALALAERDGARVALSALGELAADARLNEYQPYWAARAELLAKAEAYDEARKAYEMAIGLEHDAAVRRFLQERQSALPS